MIVSETSVCDVFGKGCEILPAAGNVSLDRVKMQIMRGSTFTGNIYFLMKNLF